MAVLEELEGVRCGELGTCAFEAASTGVVVSAGEGMDCAMLAGLVADATSRFSRMLDTALDMRASFSTSWNMFSVFSSSDSKSG